MKYFFSFDYPRFLFLFKLAKNDSLIFLFFVNLIFCFFQSYFLDNFHYLYEDILFECKSDRQPVRFYLVLYDERNTIFCERQKKEKEKERKREGELEGRTDKNIFIHGIQISIYRELFK